MPGEIAPKPTLLTPPAAGDQGAAGAGAGDAGKAGAAGAVDPKTVTTAAAGGADDKGKDATGADDKSKTGEGKTEAPAELELKVPDGVEVDAEMLGAFKEIAKESKLDGPGAQKVVDLYLKAQQDAAAKQEAAFESTQAAWVKELEADKEIGGKDFSANLQAANKALEKFGSPALKALLGRGLGNHPELVRTFVKIGKAIAEDSIAGPATSQGGGVSSEEQVLRDRYPSHYAKKE